MSRGGNLVLEERRWGLKSKGRGEWELVRHSEGRFQGEWTVGRRSV